MKICLDSVSGDPSLPMKVAIEDVMLQIWTINLSDREGILFLHLCSNGGHKPALMFGVTIQTEVSVSMRFSSCPRSSSSGGSNVTSIYKPESSGDASKITILRLPVCLFGEGPPFPKLNSCAMSEGTASGWGIFMGTALVYIHEKHGCWPSC